MKNKQTQEKMVRNKFSAAIGVAIWMFLGTMPLAAAQPTWTKGEEVPEVGRPNPYELENTEWRETTLAGLRHSLHYPVTTTITIPLRAVRNFLELPATNPFRRVLQQLFWGVSRLHSLDDLEEMVGLIPYPDQEGEGAYYVPFPGGKKPGNRMGTTFLTSAAGVEGFTFSCTACHAGQLFGRTVIGMPNRFPKSIDFFLDGRQALGLAAPEVVGATLGARAEEVEHLRNLRDSTRSVDGVHPLQLGMDSSLALVALSLSRRADDSWATPNRDTQWRPRPSYLRHARADSKPGTWWTAKYKNRWLLDGSVVSGNPIFTNILWNEIGRGADLRQLENWLEHNQKTLEELTAAVFASQAPRFSDFFPASAIDANRAKAGKQLFDQNCASCHGVYDKEWEQPGAASRPWVEQIRTSQVHYFANTPVIDVGTDPLRWQGMQALLPLNNLAISQHFGTKIELQKGYVPPPLEGVWARWPYFHNNSAPNLCAVLTRSSERPKSYFAGEAVDSGRDFSSECVGYPVAEAPRAWKTKERYFDTRRVGMSNIGHDEGIFLKQGKEIYSPEEKMQIIEFLKTL